MLISPSVEDNDIVDILILIFLDTVLFLRLQTLSLYNGLDDLSAMLCVWGWPRRMDERSSILMNAGAT